ncbi:MAG: hypothetical protein HONBIEJF_02563 [Fimbriimonadaceae bacterium]|nr:hypothetical protein [Fimbriimonadaceae bacterium]
MPRDYVSGESHSLWGKRYLLKVIEAEAPPNVSLRGRQPELRVRPGTTAERRGEIVEEWLRSQLKAAIPSMIQKWQSKLGVEIRQFHVQRMKTKWGSCSPDRHAIRLNTELAKKPIECLEYIISRDGSLVRANP